MDTIVVRDAQGVVHEGKPIAGAVPAPAGQPAREQPTWRDKIAAIAHGVEHGASVVYHHILAMEQDVREWQESNPQIAALLRTGVNLGLAAVSRTGFPVGAVSIVGTDILAACKALAAADPSVDGVNAPATAPRAPSVGLPHPAVAPPAPPPAPPPQTAPGQEAAS